MSSSRPKQILVVNQSANSQAAVLSNLLRSTGIEMHQVDFVDPAIQPDWNEIARVTNDPDYVPPVFPPAQYENGQLVEAAGQESQQIEEHHKTKAEDEIIAKLQELALDQRFTGAHHVYVINAGPTENIDPIQQSMLKAMLNQSMTAKSEVSAIMLPAEGEDVTGEAMDRFTDEVATMEALLEPFNIKLYTNAQMAVRAIVP